MGVASNGATSSKTPISRRTDPNPNPNPTRNLSRIPFPALPVPPTPITRAIPPPAISLGDRAAPRRREGGRKEGDGDEEAGAGEPVRDLRALPQVRGGGGLRGVRPPLEAVGRGGHPGEARVRLPHRGAQGLPLPRELRQRRPLRGPQDARHLPHPQRT